MVLTICSPGVEKTVMRGTQVERGRRMPLYDWPPEFR
jgi:hypothetical protein